MVPTYNRVFKLVQIERTSALLDIKEILLFILDFFVDVFEVNFPSRSFKRPSFQIFNVLKSFLVVLLLFDVVWVVLLVDLPRGNATR
jgi:hypothetical protein